jgi:hypothetical protein
MDVVTIRRTHTIDSSNANDKDDRTNSAERSIRLGSTYFTIPGTERHVAYAREYRQGT